jgi:hypothetical protein
MCKMFGSWPGAPGRGQNWHDDVLVSLGKYEEALVEYRQALQLFLAIGHCSVADCKVNIGLVCKAMGKKSEAKQMFT